MTLGHPDMPATGHPDMPATGHPDMPATGYPDMPATQSPPLRAVLVCLAEREKSPYKPAGRAALDDPRALAARGKKG
jgi:hypothetical protein